MRTYPHCDARVLHAPGECYYCDTYGADLQEERKNIGIAFTGHAPEPGESPCPADAARGDTHKQWGGNQAARKGEPHTYMGVTYIVGDN